MSAIPQVLSAVTHVIKAIKPGVAPIFTSTTGVREAAQYVISYAKDVLPEVVTMSSFGGLAGGNGYVRSVVDAGRKLAEQSGLDSNGIFDALELIVNPGANDEDRFQIMTGLENHSDPKMVLDIAQSFVNEHKFTVGDGIPERSFITEAPKPDSSASSSGPNTAENLDTTEASEPSATELSEPAEPQVRKFSLDDAPGLISKHLGSLSGDGIPKSISDLFELKAGKISPRKGAFEKVFDGYSDLSDSGKTAFQDMVSQSLERKLGAGSSLLEVLGNSLGVTGDIAMDVENLKNSAASILALEIGKPDQVLSTIYSMFWKKEGDPEASDANGISRYIQSKLFGDDSRLTDSITQLLEFRQGKPGITKPSLEGLDGVRKWVYKGIKSGLAISDFSSKWFDIGPAINILGKMKQMQFAILPVIDQLAKSIPMGGLLKSVFVLFNDFIVSNLTLHQSNIGRMAAFAKHYSTANA